MNELRPNTLEEIVGQDIIKERVQDSINACKINGEIFPHCLLTGGAVLGKTSLAMAIAEEIGVELITCNAANLNASQMASYIAQIEEGTVFFIDEVHRLSTKLSECLLTLLEDNVYYLGDSEQFKVDVPSFTFIGATTNPGLLIKPLYDRLKFKYLLEEYSEEEVCEIITTSMTKLNISIDHDALSIVAKASKGVPRIANNHIYWIRDYAISSGASDICSEVVTKAFALAKISEDGLDENDQLYLKALHTHKPQGLKILALKTGFSTDFIENSIEPYLVKTGRVKRTGRGRVKGIA